jgi:hypothetical protein
MIRAQLCDFCSVVVIVNVSCWVPSACIATITTIFHCQFEFSVTDLGVMFCVTFPLNLSRCLHVPYVMFARSSIAFYKFLR